MQTITTEELKKVIALSDLPEAHLQWLIDHSEYVEFEEGDIIMKTGEAADNMIMAMDGEISFYMDVNGKLVHYFTFGNEPTTGGISGVLPYSRMKTSPGNAYAVGKLKVLRLHKKYFPELEQLNPDFIQRCVGYMTERARGFATTQLQQEKVSALGKLSAGIAHELNNPASAINRISSELKKRVTMNYELTEKLLQFAISPAHIQSISNLVMIKEKEQKEKVRLNTMQLMEKEDEMLNWLEKNGFSGNAVVAETFAEFGFSCDDLEKLHSNTGNEAFIHVLHWLENLLNSQRILKDLEDASCRISNLVTAIKSHVHMDQTNDMQPTKVNKDIENTLTLLGYKLREKNITVKKIYSDDLPDIPAYVGELNQVWTNIIDNAIFALDKNGELTIETSLDNKNLKVSIIDNGTGIPKDILSRIFDPFFTTKKVGQGTGIGLDLVQRIIKHHNGEIKVNSVPGRTEFTICIPLLSGQSANKENKILR